MINEFSDKHTSALELDKVLENLAEYASCEDTRQRIKLLKCSNDFEEVAGLLQKTSDAHVLISKYGSPSVYGLKNIDAALTRSQAGGTLSMGDLLGIAQTLRTIRGFSDYYNKWEDEQNSLDYWFYSLMPNKNLEERIFSAIRSDDEMDDHASPTLADIRRKILAAEGKVRQILDGMIRSQHYQKYLQDALVTMRDGRYVIPVKSEHRNEITGLVHDTSSSGATMFVEPMAVVEANNNIRILRSEEQVEIDKILLAFSIEVGESAATIASNYSTVIDIDLCFSKARLGSVMKATVPNINSDGLINLKKARHPLINKDVVVPIDIELGKNFDTLMITGPNTGGKTVALKTLGLLSMMTMCGLMLPVAENSDIAVFDQILADIGEEQSIEQSLSTFSAHMTHIIEILKIANDNSLVLLDELGAGTDPVEGAALAMAILEDLRKKKARIAATTHYAELKIFALETDGVENASCEFDVLSLRPTYRLVLGVPGRSNAFAISERLGVDPEIIASAREHISSEKTRFEDVVSRLEEQRKELEKQNKLAEIAKQEAEKARQEVKNANKILFEQREKELEKARAEARTIVETVQANANALLNELNAIRKQKDSPDFRSKLSGAKSAIGSQMDKLSESAGTLQKDKNEGYKLPRPLKSGDTVLIVDIDKKGIVIDDPDNSGMVTVQAGIIKTKVNMNRLRLEEPVKYVQMQGRNIGQTGQTSKSEKGQSSREVDLRGMNVEEAIIEVDKLLDNSVFSNVSTVMLIHGKGTGALRAGIHAHLRKHKNVKSFRLGTYGEGESGVTVVEVK